MTEDFKPTEFNASGSNIPTRLISEADVAQMLSVHPKAIARLCESGRMPEPIMLTRRLKRYRLDEIESWISDGCQPRK